MLKDSFGLPITTNSSEAIAPYEHNHTALHLLNKRVTSRRFIPQRSRELTLSYNNLGLLLKAS
ncbi:hypothetical protein Cri9333_1338 [Crinalium epipsammum PCC 9333]|uniref:Uncharacterized protein n=1 Tax=Crinalium epipsammum PCC 9333 TaxID=1173022 RepID=K9VYJ3_9CYAN|nr:hypothetical protein [Crinalium epipsammum]AFZ12235.1 hypothetical protein Cri9333_1338 [Crinalium epipsammum PCC 9333]